MMDPWFYVVCSQFWPSHPNVAAEIKTHKSRQHFFKLLLSNCSEHVCNIGSVYCSVAVSMFSILRIYICLSRYLGLSTVDYLSCCCRPITLKQSGRSPPTTTRHFHTGNWMFSVKFSIKCIITAVDTLV